MKVINTGLFYFDYADGTCYRGKIELTKKEFDKAIKHILSNRKVNKHYLGVGKYPYLSKIMLCQDIAKGRQVKKNERWYALRVSATDYIVSLFRNKSRYNYNKQNYIIKVIDNK